MPRALGESPRGGGRGQGSGHEGGVGGPGGLRHQGLAVLVHRDHLAAGRGFGNDPVGKGTQPEKKTQCPGT